jgi:hypothetical protein
MNASLTGRILDMWDAGSTLDHTGRALLLLQLAQSGHEPGQRHDADLTIGERDRMLLDVREHLFGSHVDAVDLCESCGAQVQVTFELAHIRGDTTSGRPHELSVQTGDYEIEVRLPTSADLFAIRRCESVDIGRELLLARCVIRAQLHEARVDVDDLPESVRREIARAMGEADPLAFVELILACAACGHEWRRQFDIVDYLWSEVSRFGSRTLRDVHLLARHYGWSEDAIVGLSPIRRRRYLELVTNG